MQVMIDVSADPVEQLRMVHHFIGQAIAAREAQNVPTVSADEQVTPPTDDSATPSPAEVFGRSETLPDAFKPGVERVPPPPPVTPPAPVTPPPTETTTSTPTTVELDSAGVAYDPNIHSSSRAKVKDGTWKKRRGGPVSAPPPPVTPATPAVASTPPPPPPSVPAPVQSLPNDPPAGQTPPPPAAPATPAADAGPTFRSVVAKCAAAQSSGKITPQRIQELCVQAGAPDLTSLNAMPGLIPTVDALVSAELLK